MLGIRMEGKGWSVILCVIHVVMVQLGYGGAATQHAVGGSAGWTIPALKNVNYTTWARSNSFYVGDTLLFSYNKDLHTVDQVSKTDYESCNDSKPLAHHDDGNTLLRLDKIGTFYFICGVDGHCAAGQKVEIPVQKAPAIVAPAPGPAPAPEEAAAPPPMPGSEVPSPSSSVPVPSTPSPPVFSSPPAGSSTSFEPAGPPGSSSHASSRSLASLMGFISLACSFSILFLSTRLY